MTVPQRSELRRQQDELREVKRDAIQLKADVESLNRNIEAADKAHSKAEKIVANHTLKDPMLMLAQTGKLETLIKNTDAW